MNHKISILLHTGKLQLFLKRFYRRIKFAFRFNEMWNWKYESCNHCGINYRLVIAVIDEKWKEINNESEGCLCPNCFFQIAQEKAIHINLDDIDYLCIFDPDNKIGLPYSDRYIIKTKN